MGKIRLLVELGGLKTERVDDVVDLLGTILNALLGLLGGSVGTSVYGRISDSTFERPVSGVYLLTSTAPRVIMSQSTS